MEETFNLLETIHGKWVKVSPGVKGGTFLLEMGENVLLSFHVSNKNIAFHAKDENDIYQYLGDISFEAEAQKQLTLRLFSTSAADMNIGEEVFTNLFADATDVCINFSTEQRERWQKKFDL